MASLGSHPNVWNTCLQVLHRKGYRIRITLGAEDEDPDGYVADKGEFSFVADNPIELLGLVAVFEDVQPTDPRPYWWTVLGHGPTRDQLLDEATAAREARETELEALRQASPEAWALSIQNAMDNSGGIADAASQLGVSAASMRRMLAQLP